MYGYSVGSNLNPQEVKRTSNYFDVVKNIQRQAKTKPFDKSPFSGLINRERRKLDMPLTNHHIRASDFELGNDGFPKIDNTNRPIFNSVFKNIPKGMKRMPANISPIQEEWVGLYQGFKSKERRREVQNAQLFLPTIFKKLAKFKQDKELQENKNLKMEDVFSKPELEYMKKEGIDDIKGETMKELIKKLPKEMADEIKANMSIITPPPGTPLPPTKTPITISIKKQPITPSTPITPRPPNPPSVLDKKTVESILGSGDVKQITSLTLNDLKMLNDKITRDYFADDISLETLFQTLEPRRYANNSKIKLYLDPPPQKGVKSFIKTDFKKVIELINNYEAYFNPDEDKFYKTSKKVTPDYKRIITSNKTDAEKTALLTPDILLDEGTILNVDIPDGVMKDQTFENNIRGAVLKTLQRNDPTTKTFSIKQLLFTNPASQSKTGKQSFNRVWKKFSTTNDVYELDLNKLSFTKI